MSDSLLKERIEVAKNIVEILAILIAGIWAVYVFIVKDRPSLQPRALLDTTLAWEDEGPRCIATAMITFDNASPAEIDIVRSTVTGRIIPFEALPSAPAALIDFKSLLQSKGVWTLPALPGGGEMDNLVGHFSPGAKAGHSIQWLIRRPAPNREEWLYVEAKMEDRRGHVWTSGRWDYLCNQHPGAAAGEKRP